MIVICVQDITHETCVLSQAPLVLIIMATATASSIGLLAETNLTELLTSHFYL